MIKLNGEKLIGIDIGGTKINAALIKNNNILKQIFELVPNDSTNETEIINIIIDVIKRLLDNEAKGIGIGVPSLVDKKKGIIYNVTNIPSWKEVHLKQTLEEKFQLPVFIDNDANCFALGEYRFGKGIECKNLVGITIGTGMGTGIVNNGHLFKDANGGSGEFGLIPYLDSIYEDYCSGKFFENKFNSKGENMLTNAIKKQKKALLAFNEFGTHLGNVIKTIMLAIDPDQIIIGGSVSKSKDYFKDSMMLALNDFPFPKSIENLNVSFSETPNIAVLGAASLYYDYMT